MRVRRRPEDARAHILAHVSEVFAHKLPDAVGVRELAASAGVSHALITHYFQSYDNLIREVIATRLGALRELAFARLAGATFGMHDAPLLDVLLDFSEDRALVRLMMWAMLAGRSELVMGASGQLARIVDALHARLAATGAAVARDRLEFSVAAAISMVLGWSVASGALEHNLDRADRPIERPELRRELERMIRAYVVA